MNKTDILNAFREMRILNGYASIWKHHPMGVARDIDDWLLNTLTEFEREVGGRAFEEGARMMEDVGRRESQLEKEKHPSK